MHPDNPGVAGVSIVQIAEPWQGVGKASKNAVVIAPGRLDRSATGTGLSARMAALHARGLMRPGDSMTNASVLGTTFDGRIVSETSVGGRPAIVPRDQRERLDHRHQPGLPGPDGSVPGGLPAFGHLARPGHAVSPRLREATIDRPRGCARAAKGNGL